MGFFFAKDITGSVAQFGWWLFPGINYWAHVGGYLGGFLIGYFMRLYREASWEALQVKAKRFSQKSLRKKDATRLYGDILRQEPENEQALRYFFHHYLPLQPEKAGSYYACLMNVLVKKDFSKALDLFQEHFPSFMNALPGKILLQLGIHFYRNFNLEKAMTCFQLASEKEGPWQAKALFSLGITFEEMNHPFEAKKLFENVAERFPYTPFHKPALERLKVNEKIQNLRISPCEIRFDVPSQI